MKLGTTYYRLLDPEFRKVAAVYRTIYSRESLVIERYDPTAGGWMPGPSTFLRFVNEGEDGADVIPQAEATRLIAAGLPGAIMKKMDRTPNVRPLPAARAEGDPALHRLDGPGAEDAADRMDAVLAAP